MRVERPQVRERAANSEAKFAGLTGLRSKLFSVLAKLREARNVYVWDDPEVAQNFFTPESCDRIAALYGVGPIIEYAEVCTLVDTARR